MDQDKDGLLKQTRDAVIQLPSHLTTGQVGGKDGQHDIPAQRAPKRAPGRISKNVQTFHGSQIVNSADLAGLSNRRLIEGIYKALEQLLRATTGVKANDSGECRSLFSICLRQIPDYIAQEQRLTNDENPENDIDVASEVYTDLEALGLVPDGGWESLRKVVRAHGVSLVGEAIQEGLIALPFSRHILSLCLGLAAYDEAECIIESMIASIKIRPFLRKESTASCAELSQPIAEWATSHQLHASFLTEQASRLFGVLKYYVSQTDRHGFMYRQTAVMLETGILPVDWISSKAMVECWNGVIRSITQEDDQAQYAVLLLQVAISISYEREVSNARARPQIHDLRLHACEATTVRPTLRSRKSGQAVKTAVESQPIGSGEVGARPDDINQALQSTLSSILTVLSAISILRSPNSGLDSSRPNPLSVAVLRDIALEIRQVLEIANVTSCANPVWFVSANSLRLPLLSAGLVSVASRKASTEISPHDVLELATLASLSSSKESLSSSGSFLGEVARCCEEARAGDGFCFVQVMVQDLISIAVSNIYDKPVRKFCSGIAHAAAFVFSEDTGRPKHLDWALDIERTITRMVNDYPNVVVDQTPAQADMRKKSGYKWEEGICEWIAKTPALNLRRPNTMEDVDHGSTYEVPKMTLAQALPFRCATPCATERRLPWPTCNRGGQGASCNPREIENVRRSCGKCLSSEKLLFIKISPRPQKVSRPQSLLRVDAANDLDELSAPDSSQEKSVALRGIPNLLSGFLGKRSGQTRRIELTGSHDSDMPRAKRHHLNTGTFSRDTDDELGFP